MITVADMELSIVSDATPEEVENVVGILDRRMRDINLKSPHCTKNEAAILCALSYCSERISMQESYKKMESEAFRYAAENERLRKTIEKLQAETESLKGDITVMRSLLDRAMGANADGTIPPAPEAPSTYVPKPFSKANAAAREQISAFDETSDASTDTPLPEAKPRANGEKSRVGNMFDLLTFNDKV